VANRKLSDDKEEALAAAVAALAAGPEFRTVSYQFDGCTVPLTWPLRGPAASDSAALSTRVWRAALVLCRAMVGGKTPLQPPGVPPTPYLCHRTSDEPSDSSALS
jgi:hypothetical protein